MGSLTTFNEGRVTTSGMEYQVTDIFVAKITNVGPYPNDTTQYTYVWKQQEFNALTGAFTDVPTGFGGDLVNGPYLVENNNNLVSLPCYVWFRLRGNVNGQPVYEFNAPQEAQTYVGCTIGNIDASTGCNPVEGVVGVYGQNADGTMKNNPDFALSVWNLWKDSIPDKNWVQIYRDAFSDTYFVGTIYNNTCCGTSSSSSNDASCDGCYLPDDIGSQYGFYIQGNALINAGPDSASVEFLPSPYSPPTIISLDFTILNIGQLGLLFRWDCPMNDGLTATFVFENVADPTLPCTLELWSSISGSLGYTQFSGLSLFDNGSLVVTDSGSSITASVYKAMTLLDSVTVTTSDSGGNFMALYESSSAFTITGLSVVNASGTVWQDSFVDTNGTLLTDHLPDIGCDETSSWYCMIPPSPSSSSASPFTPCCPGKTLPETMVVRVTNVSHPCITDFCYTVTLDAPSAHCAAPGAPSWTGTYTNPCFDTTCSITYYMTGSFPGDCSLSICNETCLDNWFSFSPDEMTCEPFCFTATGNVTVYSWIGGDPISGTVTVSICEGSSCSSSSSSSSSPTDIGLEDGSGNILSEGGDFIITE